MLKSYHTKARKSGASALIPIDLGGKLTFAALITNGSYAQKYALQTWSVITKFLLRCRPLPNNDFMGSGGWEAVRWEHSMALLLEKGRHLLSVHPIN